MPIKTKAQEISRMMTFDGYCPESKLKGKIVEMRLNTDDFWESPATGLQITSFAPYAAILSWRGKGQFRQLAPSAWAQFRKELIFTRAYTILGREIFPDEGKEFKSIEELETYMESIREYEFKPSL